MEKMRKAYEEDTFSSIPEEAKENSDGRASPIMRQNPYTLTSKIGTRSRWVRQYPNANLSSKKRKAYYRASSKLGNSDEMLKFKSALDEVLEKEEAKKQQTLQRLASSRKRIRKKTKAK